ncbi:hypothetical protein SDC9_170036 [bioreactor metagenome]|uniref:Phage shock protein PspC N-terminal domain-containing protein n=1 Tax=bioreactor metagenome TaxID=1076179 RepID=A0A645GFX7_9ZZZZ
MLSGVLGGIAEYFDIDPTLIRLAYVLLTIFTTAFPGLIAYIIMAIIIPKQGDVHSNNEPPYYSDPNAQQPPFYTAPNYQQPPFYGNNADNSPNNQNNQNPQDPPPQK